MTKKHLLLRAISKPTLSRVGVISSTPAPENFRTAIGCQAIEQYGSHLQEPRHLSLHLDLTQLRGLVDQLLVERDRLEDEYLKALKRHQSEDKED